ncbi:phosphoglycerate dehydrogenase-like enzyme [Streptosporangium becharense]|uniref:Phosphoglycerate dehydrogenase-like enzyme n=1 Tax=Streptosporangium becharense TaxID=1816182 RepID=A0A7W9ICA4_9ACTN|nr:2-hydroxyacid dehydrogenase [Streptosporangium becharense]MBB2915028.1 phosphoglycerate dehydrogenase-like enzyme [Streptosporangium becharense]MBB5818077.1 phosphoglycerate dehydrogenase-like enzyme [Streptosporangium becharense]
MRIVCIDGEAQYRDIVDRDVARPLAAAGHTFDWFEERFDDVPAAISRAAGYDALYVVGDQGPVPDGLLRANPGLRLVSFVGTGARRFVNMAEAAETGAAVTNVPDFASASVAEHTIALTLAVARRVVEGDGIVRSGRWAKHQGLKLAGRRFGVVGAGAIGSRVIGLARGLGMTPVYWSRSRSPERDLELGARYADLDELFRSCSVVSLHLAHTPDTDRLVGRALLDLLPSDAILVNTARAEILDTAYAVELAGNGRIFGLGLDVFDREPPEPETIPGAGNIVLTPHVGFHTDEADDVFRLAGENIVNFAAGTPTNVVS